MDDCLFSVDFCDQNDGGITEGTWYNFPGLMAAERFARFVLSYAPGLYCYLISEPHDEWDEPVYEFAIYEHEGKLHSLNNKEAPARST
jgi:hypothetical protein